MFTKEQSSPTFRKDWAVAKSMMRDWYAKNYYRTFSVLLPSPKRIRRGYRGETPELSNVIKTNKGKFYTVHWADETTNTIKLCE